MTPELIRLQQNLHELLPRFSMRQLYTVARALADELTRRQLDASLEARATECALLPHAQAEQRAIYSADCSDPGDEWAEMWRGYYSRQHPLERAPADM